MLEVIRNLVYRMGFRPKPSTVLYSRPVALMMSYKEAIQRMRYPVVMDLDNRSAWSEVAGIIDRMEEERLAPDPEGMWDALYKAANFCIMCGSVLVPLVVDVKQCPHFHGKVYMGDDSRGLPVITFEPNEGDEDGP